MNLEKRFTSLVKKKNWWYSGEPVVAAVSTGVDSMVLLTLLERLMPDYRPEIIVAHVNHGLRSESIQEEQFIGEYCQRHGLTLATAHWKHPADISGMEEKAREFRYQFFAETMERYKAHTLLTAHQQDEQAETVLMKLIRSGNLAEDAGMRPERSFGSGKLIRPLLNVSKAEIEKYAADNDVKWFQDQTNFENKVLRNRVRNLIVPELKEENPSVNHHLAEFGANLQVELAGSRALANDVLKNNGLKKTSQQVSVRLSNVRPSELPLLIRALLGNLTEEVVTTDNQLEEIVNLIENIHKPQGKIELAYPYVFSKSYDELKFFKISGSSRKNDGSEKSFMVILNKWYQTADHFSFGVFSAENLPEGNFERSSFFNLKPEMLPLKVRLAKSDDVIRLANGGHQTVRRILINQKVPQDERKNVSVLVDTADHVLAVIGFKESGQSSGNLNYCLVTRKDKADE